MRIDPTQFAPEWSHTITLRGQDVPLLPPDRVDAADTMRRRRHLGLVHLPGAVWRFAHRIIFGRTPTMELRRAIAACVPDDWSFFVDDLSAAELMHVFNAYQALQADYYWRQKNAISEALIKAAPVADAPSPASEPGASASTGDASKASMRFPGVAGQLPQAIAPFFRDNRTPQEATT